MSELAIRTEALTRRFGRTIACDAITLAVPAGDIFSLLGRNGAGKSTFVKMLVGLISPSAGQARVLGRPPGDLAVRRRLGYLPENFRYADWATGAEVLAFHAALAGIEPVRRRGRIADALDRVGLLADGGRLVRGYSKGMRQRLGLAVALLGTPPLLFLDEPTSALDPLGRREVRELLVDLKARGCTIFLNSHLLSEVEMVSDGVAVMRDGRVVAAGSLRSLLDSALEIDVRVGRGDAAALRVVRATGRVAAELAEPDGSLRLRIAPARREEVPALAEAVIRAGGRLHGLTARSRSLEDLFVELVAESGPAADTGAAAAGAQPGRRDR